MNGLRWGLIGASDIAATRMIPTMRQNGHDVVGVWSGSADHAAAYAQTHQVPIGTSEMDQLLSAEIDAVYISSYNHLHVQHAKAAAAAGKHVLLEKPMALSIDDAQDALESCQRADVVLAVNHHLPGAGTHRKIRELVAAGAIGRPLSVSVRHAVLLPERLRAWRLSDQPGAGVILDITVHDASVLNPLVGSPAIEVAAIGVQQGPWEAQGEDAVMTTIRYPANVLAQTHDSFTSAFTPTRLEVHGDEGAISAVDVMTQEPDGQVFLTDRTGTREIEIEDRRGLYDIALSAFADAVHGAGRPAVTGAEGVAAFAVAQAAFDSHHHGGTAAAVQPVAVEPAAPAGVGSPGV